MALVEAQISASADDAQENGSNGVMDLTNLANRPGTGGPNLYGIWRFQLNVPQGATIDDAKLSLYFPNTLQDNVGWDIQAEYIDDSPAITTTTNNISNRTLTTALVSWVDTNVAGTTAGTYDSPELKTVIQEVVDRPGWAANNYISIIVTGTSGNPNTWTYDRGASNAAKLVVNYTASVAGGSPSIKRTITVPHISTHTVGRI